MNDIIILAFGLATAKLAAEIIGKRLTQYFQKNQTQKGNTTDTRLFTIKDYFFDWGLLFVLGLIIFSPIVFVTRNHYSMAWIWICLILTVPLLPAYNFIIRPIIFRFTVNNKFVINKDLKERLKSFSSRNVEVYVIEKDIKNIYATGIIPFTQMIYVGKPLYLNMSESSLTALLLHELGHLHHRHLLKLYAINAFCVICFASITFFFRDSITLPSAPVLSVMIRASFLAMMLILLPSLAQRSMEYQADSFAASIIGVSQYKKALFELDEISAGNVTKGNLSYPTLINRVKNIEKISYS